MIARLTALSLLFLLSTACEPTREGYVEDAAEVACARHEDCGHFGSKQGDRYSTFEECMIERQNDFNDLWPADHCDRGRINEDEFDRCMERIELEDCEWSLVDWLAFVDACSRADVCIDPPD